MSSTVQYESDMDYLLMGLKRLVPRTVTLQFSEAAKMVRVQRSSICAKTMRSSYKQIIAQQPSGSYDDHESEMLEDRHLPGPALPEHHAAAGRSDCKVNKVV
jgi:hypothetical protein